MAKNMAQNLLNKYMSDARGALKSAGAKVGYDAYTKILSQPSIKGALSRLKRLTGQDVHIHWDDDSEFGLKFNDALNNSGIGKKSDDLVHAFEAASIKLEMCTGADDAILIVREFRHTADEILASGPYPIKI